MPKLGDHKEEIDKTYTPLEARRRSEMSLRDTKYGFFRVATEPLHSIECNRCGKELQRGAQNWIRANGIPICAECLTEQAKNAK